MWQGSYCTVHDAPWDFLLGTQKDVAEGCEWSARTLSRRKRALDISRTKV